MRRWPRLSSADVAGAAASAGYLRPLGHTPTPCPLHLLDALGPVLCLFPATDPDPLAAFTRARSVRLEVRIESDGLHEALRFHDAAGRCVWRLYRLPDSDFLTWERLADSLPQATEAVHADPPALAGGGWLGLRLRPRWHGSTLRLRVVQLAVADAGAPCHGLDACAGPCPPDAPGGSVRRCWLSATPVRVSPLGERMVARIAC